jgi:hypothetical protein
MGRLSREERIARVTSIRDAALLIGCPARSRYAASATGCL